MRWFYTIWDWILRPRVVVIVADAVGDTHIVKRVAKMHDAFGALGDIARWLRTEQKYGKGSMDREKVYDELLVILNERGLDPFED